MPLLVLLLCSVAHQWDCKEFSQPAQSISCAEAQAVAGLLLEDRPGWSLRQYECQFPRVETPRSGVR